MLRRIPFLSTFSTDWLIACPAVLGLRSHSFFFQLPLLYGCAGRPWSWESTIRLPHGLVISAQSIGALREACCCGSPLDWAPDKRFRNGSVSPFRRDGQQRCWTSRS